MTKQKLIYLACPYTHREKKVREQRFQIANRVAAEMMKRGLYVFSPISHTHPIAMAGDLPKDWEYWKEYDELMLSMCSMLLVITIKGWKESVGVQAEIKIAKEFGIPVVIWPSDAFYSSKSFEHKKWIRNGKC